MAIVLNALVIVVSLLLLTTALGDMPPVPADWELVFEDNFDDNGDGPAIDPTKWTYEYGYNPGTQEVAWFTNRTKNVFRANNSLVLKAYKEDFSYPGGVAHYTAGSVQSIGAWAYGRIEASIQLPAGRGTWPAFWMLNRDVDSITWPLCGEIDILENVGFEPNMCYCTLHDDRNNGMLNTQIGNHIPIAGMYNSSIVYVVDWTPENMTFYADGHKVLFYANNMECSNRTWPWKMPFNIKLNLAIGGSWGGQQGIDDSIFPVEMVIDYVRVYQPNTQMQPPPCERYHYYLALASDSLGSQIHRLSMFEQGRDVTKLIDELKKDLRAALPAYTIDVRAVSPMPVMDGLMHRGRYLFLVYFDVTNVPHTDAAFQSKLGQLREASFDLWLSNVTKLLRTYMRNSSWSLEYLGDTNPWQPTWGGGVPAAAESMPASFRNLPATINIAHYDFGGFDHAYWDTTAWNVYGSYMRSPEDWTDLSPTKTDPHVWDGQYAVGYIVNGEYLRISGLNVSRTADDAPDAEGKYFTIDFEYANGMPTVGELQMELDGQPMGFTWWFPPTVDWETFSSTTTSRMFNISYGMHTVKLVFPTPNYRLLSISFVEVVPPTRGRSGDYAISQHFVTIICCAVAGFAILLAVGVVRYQMNKKKQVEKASRKNKIVASVSESDALVGR